MRLLIPLVLSLVSLLLVPAAASASTMTTLSSVDFIDQVYASGAGPIPRA